MIEVDVDLNPIHDRAVYLNSELDLRAQLRNERRVTAHTEALITRLEPCPVAAEFHAAAHIEGKIRVLRDETPPLVVGGRNAPERRRRWQEERRPGKVPVRNAAEEDEVLEWLHLERIRPRPKQHVSKRYRTRPAESLLADPDPSHSQPHVRFVRRRR